MQEYIQPNANQQLMYQRLQECHPGFQLVLGVDLCKGDGTYGDDVRQTAGLLLKNNLKTTWQFSEEPHESFIRDALTGSMTHPSRIVRRVVGTSLAICVRQKGWQSTPQLWQLIAENLDASKDPNALDGALDALYKICEETNGYLESDAATGEPSWFARVPGEFSHSENVATVWTSGWEGETIRDCDFEYDCALVAEGKTRRWMIIYEVCLG